ncbi:hypothetical protein EAH76_10775 [Sphingomonas glacialis]|uniref:Uncharacterized protein n=1 Tax=Sphingomonas glacialis TaxID=658225 RepID=A0A502FZP9_9SPHN|nr:hypothetical protein EAH76_10775 [Sphingomonas glacialis]
MIRHKSYLLEPMLEAGAHARLQPTSTATSRSPVSVTDRQRGKSGLLTIDLSKCHVIIRPN